MTGNATKKDLAERIFFRIYQCNSLMHKTATQAVEKFGVTSHQWILLGALSHPDIDDGLTVGDMMELLQVSRQSLTPTLSRLENDDYIERVQSEHDARAKVVKLTPAGEQLWKDMQDSIGEYFDQALKEFSVTDHVAALHFFNRLLENLISIDARSTT